MCYIFAQKWQNFLQRYCFQENNSHYDSSITIRHWEFYENPDQLYCITVHFPNRTSRLRFPTCSFVYTKDKMEKFLSGRDIFGKRWCKEIENILKQNIEMRRCLLFYHMDSGEYIDAYSTFIPNWKFVTSGIYRGYFQIELVCKYGTSNYMSYKSLLADFLDFECFKFIKENKRKNRCPYHESNMDIS
jgi:hypothetical protein